MAQPNITLKPYSGTEKESFREFERLLRSIIGVAGIAAGQQANFMSLHLRDSALRYFQTLDDATRADINLSLTALRNHFCNPQLQELHVIKLESLRFDQKTDTPENFLVTLQNMAVRAYPDPTPNPVAAADPALDAGAERARIDRENAVNAQNLLFAQTERGNQIKRLFVKCMPSWLRAKLLEQPDNATVDDLCLFARKQLTIHNLCKTDEYADGAFSEMSNTVSENLVNALSKLTQTSEAMENKVNELSKQFEEQKLQHQQQEQVLSQQGMNAQENYYQEQGDFRGSYRGRNRGGFGFRGRNRGRNNYRGNSNNRGNWRGRGYYNNNKNYPRNNNFSQQLFPAYANQQAAGQVSPQAPPAQASSSNAQPATVQITPPAPPGHIETVQYSSVTCFICGYPNHTAATCSLRGRGGRRGGGSFPFNRKPKN